MYLGAGTMLALASACTVPACADEAAALQNNPAHSGSVVLKGLQPPLKQKWARSFEGAVSYPLIANGMAFVTVADSNSSGTILYALDVKTGQLIWHNQIDGFQNCSNATYDNGRVFVLSDNHHLLAFPADNVGTLLWNVRLSPSNAFSPPVAAHGKVYIGGGPIVALDETTGAQKWIATTLSTSQTPAVGDRGLLAKAFASGSGWHFYKLALGTGAQLWHTDFVTSYDSKETPAYYRKRLFSRDGTVLDAASGNTIDTIGGSSSLQAFWTDSLGHTFRFGNSSSQLSSTDVDTGQAAWTFTGDGQLTSAPLVINGRVAIGSYSGTLYLLDAATGQQVWSINAGAPITGSFEAAPHYQPVTALGAAEGTLLVPASNLLVAYVSKKH
jgi:outer membrane protein assembly factor BamB